jgi:hypothetical protein
VTFNDGATALATVNLSTAGQASYTTSSLTGGSHTITAAYSNTDGNFSASSAALKQTVNRASRKVTLASSPNPSLFGQSVTFNTGVVTSTPPLVNPTGTVTFYDGYNTLATIPLNASTGQAQLTRSTLRAGSHTITATYSGDNNFNPATATLTQQINYGSCISNNLNSDLIVASGQSICLTDTGKVNGNVTVQSGGTFSVVGGTVNGNATVQDGGALATSGGTINGAVTSSGARFLSICGAKAINGALNASTSTGSVIIGDAGDDGSPACGPNSLGNSVSLTSNTGGVEVGGDTINGNLTLTNNTGTGPPAEDTKPEIEANKVKGNLACSGNDPAPINDRRPNTVSGSRTGQCGSGF